MANLFSTPLLTKSSPPVPGMVVWYDATQTSTGNVSTLADFSGNGNAATSSVTPPVCSANQIGGKNGISFIDATNILSAAQNADMNFTNSVTFFLAGTVSSTVGGSAERFLSKAGAFGIGRSGGGTGMLFTTFGVQDYPTVNSYFIANTPIIMAVTFDASNNANFYKNGIFGETVTGSAPANTNANPLIVSSTTEPWDGLISEIIFYNRLLLSNEVSSVNHYLSNKWNIT